MEVPIIRKATTATVDLLPHLDIDGSAVLIALIKQRFTVTRKGDVQAVGGAEAVLCDEPWDPDAPDTSSVRVPSDVCLAKPSTDVIVAGSAMAPYREPVTSLNCLVRVGPVEKMFTVHGPRLWYEGAFGLTMTPPRTFEALAVRWEYAWGGADFVEGQKPLEEARNPVGRGVVRDKRTLVHQLGPQIEDPANPITRHGSHVPVGIGATGRHWHPRRTYAGTYDELWKAERMPLLPLDFDPRFHQAAAPGLVTPQPLRGGERCQIVHMCADGPLDFLLPVRRYFVGVRYEGRGLVEVPPMLDTVLLEPDERRVTLTWRAILPLPRRMRDVHYVQVHEKKVI
ncbi:MAG: DUF2169 domain-containing protein [Polyangiales bacterium]|nr:DUF2169 domain-containing protein [Myxococcales bacterium]